MYPNYIIAGDFNAQFILWDEIQLPDQRGANVEDWVIDNDLSIMNDGTPTRVNPTISGFFARVGNSNVGIRSSLKDFSSFIDSCLVLSIFSTSSTTALVNLSQLTFSSLPFHLTI